ncbi:hypothetical protein N7517_009885 [Penicillium concentricum]|uniref:Uncharacterized protein n=1 Tax=Penicillium concentricum TaxID=293559 RepID=A0A9W9RKR4_9EURO|nr:uncharacterized protein N7517_009885 [Penicillium concentricum]KAJ5360694.1 hypothetical protein N7517_009885 [Penicillium concentricum]
MKVEVGPSSIVSSVSLYKIKLIKKKGDYVHAEGTGDVGWQDLTIEEQEKWNHTTMAHLACGILR